MNNITLTPAFGRDYTTAKQAKEAYKLGVDWVINQFGHRYDGKRINRAQVEQEGLAVTLRFCKNRKVCTP